MLQRAASNAYSWWWASHIRTKQSKWLEQNLQDMEEKVQYVLKLITEDGDSFAKRAEMYYKRRPELILFVEETYKAYRSLAERYDHLSTELQNANNTIASVFPEQVQFAMDNEEEALAPRPKSPLIMPKNVSEVPKAPAKDLKSLLSRAAGGKGKFQPQKSMKKPSAVKTVKKSGLSKSEGLEEIDKIQKHILALQTKKEFVKSSYENGLAKYWEIENNIVGMQEKVSNLQDEFGEGHVIQDDDARSLMAAVALKSCEDTLTQLQKKQESSAEETRVESVRVKDARKIFESLKNKLSSDATDEEVKTVNKTSSDHAAAENATHEKEKLAKLEAKIKEQYDAMSNEPVTVSEMAEKINEVVSKVINLETAISSQTALVDRLRNENNEIYEQIRILEEEKSDLVAGKNDLSTKLKELEEALRRAQELKNNAEGHNNNLHVHFTEAHYSVHHISHVLENVKPDEEPSASDSSNTNQDSRGEATSIVDHATGLKEVISDEDQKPRAVAHEGKENSAKLAHTTEHEGTPHPDDGSVKAKNTPSNSNDDKGKDSSQSPVNEQQEETLSANDGFEDANDELSTSAGAQGEEISTPRKTMGGFLEIKANEFDHDPEPTNEDKPDWQKLFTTGMTNKDQIILKEYTTTLRNYKDLKKKFSTTENDLFETSVQMKQLKSSNAAKDEEIKALHKKLDLLVQSFSGNEEALKDLETPTQEEESDPIKDLVIDNAPTTSVVEERFRASIDELLEENLDFWLKFSTSFHEIQKYETRIQDLQSDISKLEERRKHEGSIHARSTMKSEARPLYTHLLEIQTELNVWLARGSQLQDELQCRFASLCDIQEEITKALKISAEDGDFDFTSYQAAKFKGEILNMKQENNKVGDELQAGMDHVATLQLEVEKATGKLNDEYKFTATLKKQQQHSQQQQQHSQQQQQPAQAPLPHAESRSRVPLRSFIFGATQKKQKKSFFSVVAPAMHKKYHGKSSSRSTSSHQ